MAKAAHGLKVGDTIRVEFTIHEIIEHTTGELAGSTTLTLFTVEQGTQHPTRFVLHTNDINLNPTK